MKNSRKLLLTVFSIIGFTTMSFAQNPRGVEPLTPEQEQMLNDIPELLLSNESAATPLPFMADNSLKPYFREPFSQKPMSCVHAAEIGYVFTYEMNRKNNTHFNPDDTTTFYPPGFTWNFRNNGQAIGDGPTAGFDVAEAMGVPNAQVFGGMYNDITYWMTGYDKYHHAQQNYVTNQFTINIGTSTGLDVLKHYLSDHNAGEETGGIVTFVTSLNYFIHRVQLPEESYDAGAWVLTDMVMQPNGPSGHEMTIVGYNDNVMVDINGDGEFTNDVDLNGDGVITMRDWEVGALKVANTLGSGWLGGNTETNKGFVYWPYRLIAPNEDGDYSISNQRVYGINVSPNHEPVLVLKTKLEYDTRKDIHWNLGTSTDPLSTSPQEDHDIDFYRSGALPMQGINNDPIEISFDFTREFSNTWAKKLFFKVYTDADPGGQFISYILEDNDNASGQITAGQINSQILNENNTPYFIVDYDYISSVFTEDAVINEDFTVNKRVVFKEDANLRLGETNITFSENGGFEIPSNNKCYIVREVLLTSTNAESGIYLDGELIIQENSTLIVGSNVVLQNITKKGKIIVSGTLQLSNQDVKNLDIEIQGNGVLLIENDVTIDENSSLIIQNAGVITSQSGANHLSIYGSFSANQGSEISDFGDHDQGGLTYRGSGSFALVQANITNTEITANCNGFNPVISQCQFNASPLYIVGDDTNECSISNNQFTNSTGTSALKIEGFPKYIIDNNTFTNNFCDAISIYKSGNKVYRAQVITNNTIHHNSNLQNAKGIVLYASVAEIFDNTIHSNDYGVALYHNSSVRMYGDPEKASQQIYGNEYNQIIAVDNSFPWYFKWNVVHDAGSPYAIVYCRDIRTTRYDVSENCWGDKFNPFMDLNPFEYFTVFPEWDCGLNPDGSGTAPAPRLAYEAALEKIANEDYSSAESELKTIVATWPDSKYAITALKTLPVVAEKNNTLNNLLHYYNTNQTIQNDPELTKIAGYLKADCNVKKGSYQEALDFYAGVIDNPPTPEDETYAIIDAGYVHYLMDGGNKAQGTFKYAELIPKTKQAYAVRRKQLLDELGGEILQVNKLKNAENESLEAFAHIPNELSIYPNPTSSNVNIDFTAQESGNVYIEIMNTSGRCVYSHTITEQTTSKINHSFSTKNMASGIYYVQISINDKYVTGKKLVVY